KLLTERCKDRTSMAAHLSEFPAVLLRCDPAYRDAIASDAWILLPKALVEASNRHQHFAQDKSRSDARTSAMFRFVRQWAKFHKRSSPRALRPTLFDETMNLLATVDDSTTVIDSRSTNLQCILSNATTIFEIPIARFLASYLEIESLPEQVSRLTKYTRLSIPDEAQRGVSARKNKDSENTMGYHSLTTT
ncbi:unnamed protein product, partial [Nesidiocoris tenuis]